MRTVCNIVRDLMPLYADKLASDESAVVVSEHLKECKACRKYFKESGLDGGVVSSASEPCDERGEYDKVACKIASRRRLIVFSVAAVFAVSCGYNLYMLLRGKN